MDLLEVKLLQALRDLPFRISKRREFKGHLVVNDLAAIPVSFVNNSYDRGTDADIYDDSGSLIGNLCLTKGLCINGIGTITHDRFVCMVKEIGDHLQFETVLDLLGTSPYCFQNDYALIKFSYLSKYLDDYYNSAPLWGGFCHHYIGISLVSYKKSVARLTATKQNGFSTNYFYEPAVRALHQPLAFERFLKFYHLLELNFDLDLIQRIKATDVFRDSKQIAVLLNDYKKQDLERLVYLFVSYCSDIGAIENKLNEVARYLVIAKEIFFDFGKDSNPITEDQFDAVTASSLKFTQANCHLHKVPNCNNALNYNKFIAKMVMYIIYRVRNSIAHSKIGEYVMTVRDEEFVAEFCEPLLMEVIRQVYK